MPFFHLTTILEIDYAKFAYYHLHSVHDEKNNETIGKAINIATLLRT